MHDYYLNLLYRFVENYPFPLWEAFLRILFSALLGALIGLERERRRQPAGLRTHAVLSIGSTLITLVSIFSAYTYGGFTADPSRITAQIVSGIGFLGAGAILRFGVTVKGLTTAASLWSTAGIGISVGLGMYTLSVFTTVIMLLFLSLVSKIERELIRSKGLIHIRVVSEDIPNVSEKISEVMSGGNLVKFTKRKNELEFLFAFPDYVDAEEKIKEALKLKEVREVEVI